MWPLLPALREQRQNGSPNSEQRVTTATTRKSRCSEELGANREVPDSEMNLRVATVAPVKALSYLYAMKGDARREQ